MKKTKPYPNIAHRCNSLIQTSAYCKSDTVKKSTWRMPTFSVWYILKPMETCLQFENNIFNI